MSSSASSQHRSGPGLLFVVALPIGNLADLSPRARDILQSVDIVAAEDTRVFQELAARAQLPVKRTFSHHDFNESESAKGLLKEIQSGATVALVSDAGTPHISDPGFAILSLAFNEGIRVIPIPGPSAVATALSVCPIGDVKFQFLGYAPSKASERQDTFQRLQGANTKTVFFETPHRLLDHLNDASSIFGSDLRVFIGREMTKTYEEYLFSSLAQLLAHFQDQPPKGEFVIIYPPLEAQALSITAIDQQIRACLDKGLHSKAILEKLKGIGGLSRQELYDRIQECKRNTED